VVAFVDKALWDQIQNLSAAQDDDRLWNYAQTVCGLVTPKTRRSEVDWKPTDPEPQGEVLCELFTQTYVTELLTGPMLGHPVEIIGVMTLPLH
jgi:hypothetical protein